MNPHPRRQSILVLVIAATVLVLTAVVPMAGAIEPLDATEDTTEPVTDVVETVEEEATETVEEETSSTTSSSSSTTSSSTTTSSTTTTSTTTTSSTTTTTTTLPAEPTEAAGPAAEDEAHAVASDHAASALAPATDPVDAPDVAPFSDFDGGHAGIAPPARTLPIGPRSTVGLVDDLRDVGATTTLLAKVLAPFPVAGPASYSDDWHAPRHGGRLHKGTDIFADRGTPVIAAADGTVGNMTTTALLGGISLRLTAPNDTYFYYAHLDRFAPGLTNGDDVSAGDVIGYVGNTGNAITTPPHLHFEIHPNGGESVPAVPYLDRWLAEARVRASALAGAPSADALVGSGVKVAARPVPDRASPTPLDASAAPAAEPATGLASARRTASPIDPGPLGLLFLPLAWLAHRGIRRVRAPRHVR